MGWWISLGPLAGANANQEWLSDGWRRCSVLWFQSCCWRHQGRCIEVHSLWLRKQRLVKPDRSPWTMLEMLLWDTSKYSMLFDRCDGILVRLLLERSLVCSVKVEQYPTSSPCAFNEISKRHDISTGQKVDDILCKKSLHVLNTELIIYAHVYFAKRVTVYTCNRIFIFVTAFLFLYLHVNIKIQIQNKTMYQQSNQII